MLLSFRNLSQFMNKNYKKILPLSKDITSARKNLGGKVERNILGLFMFLNLQKYIDLPRHLIDGKFDPRKL